MFTLAISWRMSHFSLLWLKASLGVEIGGTASRERNRETTASGGREGKKPVLSFLLFSFLFTLRFLLRTSPCYLNALISQSSNKGRTVRQGSFSCSSFKHRSVGLWVGGRKGLYAAGVGWRNIPSSYIFFEKMFVFLFAICRIDFNKSHNRTERESPSDAFGIS